MEKEGGSRVGQAVVSALAAALLLATGFWWGRWSITRRFEEHLRSAESTETLGSVAREDRAGKSLAYDDPEQALAEMDQYSWAVPNIPTPFVGVAPEPGRHGNATIGPDQFRHPRKVALPKPPGTFRIFFTGGSTAYGTGAPSDAETIEGFFQQQLDRELAPRTGLTYEVINAANSAWASTHERILIENKLSEMEPDLVISLSGNNELHWGYLGLIVLWFRNYAETQFGFLLRQVYQCTGRDFGMPAAPDIAGPVPLDLVVQRLRKNLTLAVAALEPTGATYVFALQPTLAATGKPLTDRERAHREANLLQLTTHRQDELTSSRYFELGYERLRAELPAVELPRFQFIDLTGVFDDMPPGTEVFVDSYHFGDRGNRRIAERLFEELLPLLARP
jgi:hypothetical protein